MKKAIPPYVLIVMLCFLSSLLLSQSRLSGVIRDTQGEGMDLANVLILSAADSTFVRGGVTDDEGRYLFEKINAGAYFIKATMIGYNSNYTTAFHVVAGEDMNLDAIQLEEGITLSAAEVVGEAPLFVPEIDRLVINVASSIVFGSTTALDVLERSPGVVVDRQNNRISILGKDGVNVMENGKLRYMPVSALLQYLDGISSDNVQKIELITTPPAKFDAEGDAGYINIVLKKSPDEGVNGSFSLAYGYGRGHVGNNNLNLNFRKNKLFLYGSYSFLLKDQEQSFITNRSIQTPDELNESNSSGLRKPTQRNHNVRFGLDYQLSNKTVIGGMFTAYDNNWTMDALTTNHLLNDQTLYAINSIEAMERSQWRHYGANFNIKHQFSDKEFISADVDYLYYRNENPINYINTVSDGDGNFQEEIHTRSSKVTPLDILVGKVDYHKDLNEKVKLDAGAKVVRSTFENVVLVETQVVRDWVPDHTLSSNSMLAEEILAAYLSTDLQLGKKTKAKVGLRYEFTDSKLDSETDGRVVDRQFGNLFPSVFLTHPFSESVTGNLSYSRRITRPTFKEMAPFAFLIDPSTFFSGNAAIQPAISDAVKLDVRYKSLFFSVQYTVQDSAIARFQQRYDPESERLLLVTENLKNSKILSFTIGFPLQIRPWWNSRTNAMFFYQENNSYISDQPFRLRKNYVQFNTSHSFKLPKGYSTEIAFFYTGPRLIGVLNFGEIYGLNLGLQKRLGGQWGTFRLNVSDALNSVVMRGMVSVPDQNLTYNGEFDFSQRTFTLSYSRNFGNQKLRSAPKRQRGAAEESKRMN